VSADILDLTARLRRRPADDGRLYHCMLRDGEVTVGDLMYALRHTDIVITTDDVGNQILHRRPQPPDAA